MHCLRNSSIRHASAAGLFLEVSVALAMTGAAFGTPSQAPDSRPGVARTIPELFAAHCAPCHGDRGRADGEASDYLFPPARDFTRGSFRIVSTVNGVPLDADLMATIRRGLPGTGMPPFPWLEEAELAGLAQFVRGLAVDGLCERLERQSRRRSSKETPAELRARAVARLSPGQRLPKWAPATGFETRTHALERGEVLYRERCAMCHGADGQGTPAPRPTDDGEVSWARDLRLGELKGGTTRQALADRIRAGMPGSAMPATHLESEDLAALVEYVVDMLPKDASGTPLPEGPEPRSTLVARRVAALDDLDGDPALWEGVPSIRVPLYPLWWRAESIREVRLRAIHDGARIALRVDWADDSSQPRVQDDAQRSDALALQFSAADRPPLFGMGAPDHGTAIWYWRAVRLGDVAGWLDLVEARGKALEGQGGGRVDAAAPSMPAEEDLISRRIDRFHGQGIGAAGSMPQRASGVTVTAQGSGTGWSVVFSRDLGAEGEGDLAFVPGGRVQVSVAAWNGSAGDRGGQKAVGIWQELRLDP